MQVNNTTPITYRAHIPASLKNRLFMEAHKTSINTSFAFLEQAGKFKNWGQDTSSLTLIEKKSKNGIERTLGLVNSYFAPFQKIIFPKKETLLETFMALTEQDIIKAEYEMKV